MTLLIIALAAATRCLLLAGLVSEPQDPPPSLQTFRTGVDIVQVDVSVLDRDRRPVRGLAATDFTVFEDGKERPVVAFSAVDLPAATAPTTPWMRDVAPDVVSNLSPQEGRLVVILLDRTIRPQLQPMGRRVAEAAIDALGPGDLAAVVYSGPGVPQNFTADRSLLRAAINRPFVALSDKDMGNPGECYCGTCSLEAMTQVADVVREAPQRRKTLLFIGDYVGIVDWVYNPPIRVNCQPVIKDAREKLTRAAQAANLTLHAIDPRGLEVGGLDASTTTSNPLATLAAVRSGLQSRLDGLRVLADVTDGRAVLNTNAPGEEMASVMGETSSYYVLGFQSSDTTREGRSHKIEVKVKRRGVRIQSRRGHGSTAAAPSRTTSADDPPARLADAVKDLLPKTGLEITVAVAPFASSGRTGAEVVVAVGVRQPRNPSDPAGQSPREPESVEIFTGAFDADGRNVAWLRQSVEVTPETTTDGFRYDALTRLTLTPGRYEIRVAARHRLAERVGSVYAYVDVPDFGKAGPWLSGLVLASPATLLATPAAAVAELSPVVPTSQRAFARTGNVTAFVRVYRGGGNATTPVALRARIIDAASQSVFEHGTTLQATELARERGAEVRLDLPLERLAPGEYLLTIEVTRGAKETARRDVRFAVR
jgi:VWFA-related protein